MISGSVSDAILVNLGDARYFQHGGNLMVKIIAVFFFVILIFYLD
jgi:hypothetical protein